MQLVRKIQKALDDLHFLLEQVRDYSATIILERRFCSLHALIRETWQEILDAKKIEMVPNFELEKSADFPNECFVDCDRIQQVVRNLLENAFFACGAPGQIRVGLSLANDNKRVIRIEISDDGAGIPDENLDLIFNPFFTTKTKGTGLGLALSRRIIQAHHGRIFVEHSEPHGARFVVQLPIRTR
jgi:signal transduction histidine kinase